MKLANADDRGTFIEEISQATGLPVEDAEGALLELIAGVENALRDQETGRICLALLKPHGWWNWLRRPSCSIVQTGKPTQHSMVGGHRETWRLKSPAFRRWLAKHLYEKEGKVPSSQALQDAFGPLEGKALSMDLEYAVFTRLAEHDGCIYLDLANEAWEVIEITTTDWQVVVEPPVRFRRPRGMLPLPYPSPGRGY